MMSQGWGRRLTILCSSCVAKGQAGNALLVEQAGQIAGNRVLKGGEVCWFWMKSNVTQPKVCRDQSPDCSVLHGRTLLSRQAHAHRVESVEAIAHQAEILLKPQLEVAFPIEGFRGRRIVQTATARLAVGVEDIHLEDFSRFGVGDVGHAGEAIDGPDLLARRRYKDLDIFLRVADAEGEGVPRAVDSHPALVGRNPDGRGHRGDAGQQLEAGRGGDVLLDILGGGGQEQRGGGKSAESGVAGAGAARGKHGRREAIATKGEEGATGATQPRQ